MDRLEGKVTLVTGGGSGIGRAIALAFAAEGARVFICGRRRERLDATVLAGKHIGRDIIPLQADLSRSHDIDRMMERISKDGYSIDILVNNAGIGAGGSAIDTDLDTWEQVMATNLRAPFLLIQKALPAMRARRSGHIINISSESGIEHYPGDAVYGLSKHALNDFGEYVQRENQDYNIRINTICPGMVVTEMTEHAVGLDHSKCLYPEDIADLVIWLVTRRPNIKIGTPILIQTMLNPWE